MDSCLPPKHADVLVIGGGPAGSYAAAALAREGINVVLFEAAKFPRYHIGESLIPSARSYLRYIDAEKKLATYGFQYKPGSAIKFNQFKREGYTDFIALGGNGNAWNVVRSEFDQLLLDHARTCGVHVYEETKVTEASFSADGRIDSVAWTRKPLSVPFSVDSAGNETANGVMTFKYLIDASGRAGFLSTKYLKNRHFNESLKNIAIWGYWKNVGTYGVGTTREGAPWFEALTDESGWAWFIPLHNGTTSVGIVMNQEIYNARCGGDYTLEPPFLRYSTLQSNMTQRYLSFLTLAPGLVKLVGKNGELSEENVKSASDFSYSASTYAGSGYRIVGDAGAFIDPFFSSGIHLAMTSALSAAATICASIRGDCSEDEAAEWHAKRVGTSYTRFQIVVLSAYKQIRAQTSNILSDISEDNFDQAFALLRPVIQGAGDMGNRLSETEVQNTMDFCAKLFSPTTPEDHRSLSEKLRLGSALLDVRKPIFDPRSVQLSCQDKNTHNEIHLECIVSSQKSLTSDETMILEKVNARKVVQNEYAINNMEIEAINGYAVRLKRGELGLKRVVK